ncbi:MAG: toxin-antitoxin system HicB family antitoxin [Bacteroidota bacterium]|nr:toxin-antitoxin system HicB family antitoxin [Bacteroidota bacterium]
MSTKTLDYYESLDYNVIIKSELLDNEKWYVAFCVEFGVNACHGIGRTPSVAVESFIEEKNGFIKFLFQKGDPIPEPKEMEELNASGTFTIRTSPWIHSLLIKQAKEFDVSLNSYVNQLLSYGVGCDSIANIVERKFEDMNSKFLFQTDKILIKINTLNYSQGHFTLDRNDIWEKENKYRQAV